MALLSMLVLLMVSPASSELPPPVAPWSCELVAKATFCGLRPSGIRGDGLVLGVVEVMLVRGGVARCVEGGR